MRYLPIQLDVAGREALVVGAGREALSKVDRLIDAGARVTVIVERDPGPELEARAAEGKIALLKRTVEDRDLTGKTIVFVATPVTSEGEARARRWHAAARAAGTLVCTIDRPEASTFVNAAIARAPGLVMTFSTGGASPGAARRVREDLEALFADPRWARFVDALARLRASLPRGARAARMAEAVKGFAIEATLRFPAWFEDPPQ